MTAYRVQSWGGALCKGATGPVLSCTLPGVAKANTPEAPYVVADVELDEGWHMFAWIVAVEPDEVRIDMAVRVRFVADNDGQMLPAFEPV